MRIISFIDQRDVLKKILEHLGLWKEAQAPPDRNPARREITVDLSYRQLMCLRKIARPAYVVSRIADENVRHTFPLVAVTSE
jgi:hypothetical protein